MSVKNYEMPTVEVITIEVEDSILATSGTAAGVDDIKKGVSW